MVRVSSPAKLRPWSELTAKMVMAVVPGLVKLRFLLGNEIQPKVFLTGVFGNLLGSWTSAPSGHGCPHRNACLSRILTALTEVKILNVYFWGTGVYFWGTGVYFWG